MEDATTVTTERSGLWTPPRREVSFFGEFWCLGSPELHYFLKLELDSLDDNYEHANRNLEVRPNTGVLSELPWDETRTHCVFNELIRLLT